MISGLRKMIATCIYQTLLRRFSKSKFVRQLVKAPRLLPQKSYLIMLETRNMPKILAKYTKIKRYIYKMTHLEKISIFNTFIKYSEHFLSVQTINE